MRASAKTAVIVIFACLLRSSGVSIERRTAAGAGTSLRHQDGMAHAYKGASKGGNAARRGSVMGAVPGIVGGTAGALTASAGASASNMIQWSVAKSPHKLPRPATGGPVQVKVNMDVHQMYEIKPQDTSMVLELRLEVEWNNPHLIGVVGPTTVTAPGPNGTTTSVSAVATRVLPENEVKFMWLPSITFSNEIDLPIEVASRATLSSNGNVNYLRRFKLTAAEDFSGLVDYLESYANSAEDVQLMAWDGTNVESRENKMLVKSIPPEAKKNQGVFDILGSVLELEIRRTLNSDKATIIICKLFVVRRFIMAIFEIVIPLFLTVSFTMVGLFYRLSVVDVRTNLCMIGFLTTVMYLFIIKQDLPPISYLTWTHYYMIVCLCFVCMVIVEITVMHHLDPSGAGAEQQEDTLSAWDRGEHNRKEGPTRAQMSQAFSRIDADQDGSINCDELLSAFHQVGVSSVTMEDIRDFIEEATEASLKQAKFHGIDSPTKAAALAKEPLLGSVGEDEETETWQDPTAQRSAGSEMRDEDEDKRPDTYNRTWRRGSVLRWAEQGGHRNDLLTREEFIWVVGALHDPATKIGSKMVSMKVKMKMIQQLGLVQSSLPVIDLWCRRILPLLFTVTVFIMVMAETQNMQWKGPPEYVQIIENEVAAVTSGSNGNGQAFTPQLQ